MLNSITLTSKEFEYPFRQAYRKLFRELFEIDARKAGTNNFWLPFCFVREESEKFHARLAYWYNRYGYARNLATTFYLAFFYCFTLLFAGRRLLAGQSDYWTFLTFSIPAGSLACAFLLLGRFFYLFSAAHSKFLYRAFVYLAQRQIRSRAHP